MQATLATLARQRDAAEKALSDEAEAYATAMGALRAINVYLVVYFVIHVYFIGALRVGHEAERRRLASEIEAERERSQARYQLLLSNFYFTLLNTLLFLLYAVSLAGTLRREPRAVYFLHLCLTFYSYALPAAGTLRREPRAATGKASL